MTLKKILHKLNKAKRQPNFLFYRLLQNTWFIWPHQVYIQLIYKVLNGKWLNLTHPCTFNEKLNWLKLHDHNHLYNILADKYAVKEFVANQIGKEYIVPCLGIWDSFGQINFDSLPQQFVLKATHNSGGIYVCHSREKMNMNNVKRIFEKAMKTNWFSSSGEWVYKNLKPRIIADTFLDDGRNGELQDYKFWCFGGIPRIMYLTNKGESIYENFYDMDFQPVNINHGSPRKIPEYEKPTSFELMKELAAKLAVNIPFVRIDFFCIKSHVYFSEYTFYDWGGMKAFGNPETDLMLGNWLKLPINV